MIFEINKLHLYFSHGNQCSSLLTASHSLDSYKHSCCLSVSVSLAFKVMLAVVYVVVRENEKGASRMTVWDAFHVILGRIFVSGLRTKKP